MNKVLYLPNRNAFIKNEKNIIPYIKKIYDEYRDYGLKTTFSVNLSDLEKIEDIIIKFWTSRIITLLKEKKYDIKQIKSMDVDIYSILLHKLKTITEKKIINYRNLCNLIFMPLYKIYEILYDNNEKCKYEIYITKKNNTKEKLILEDKEFEPVYSVYNNDKLLFSATKSMINKIIKDTSNYEIKELTHKQKVEVYKINQNKIKYIDEYI